MTNLIYYCDLDETICVNNTMKLQIRQINFLSRCGLIARSRGSKWRLKTLLTKMTIGMEFNPLWNRSVISLLLQAKKDGAEIVLSTAAELNFASRLIEKLELFDRVIGTEVGYHNKGRRKAKKILEDASGRTFTYIGDSLADFQIWKHATVSISVKSGFLIKQMSSCRKIDLSYL
jgi:hypothetical protein